MKCSFQKHTILCKAYCYNNLVYDRGLKISISGVVVFVVGFLVSMSMIIFTCDEIFGPPVTDCNNPEVLFPFAIMTFIGLGMIFLGTRLSKIKT